MRSPIVAGIAVLTGALVAASFSIGRVSERRMQQRSVNRSRQDAAAVSGQTIKLNHSALSDLNQNDHLLVANVASVSFGELWDVVRAGTPTKRMQWAKEIEQLPPGPRRNGALKSFYKIWGELDPKGAIQGVESLSDKRMQSMAFVALSETAADSALPAIAELEFRLGRQSSQFNLASPLHRWSAADPEGVAKFLQAHPNNQSGHFLDVAYGWANNDPQKAAEWFLNLKLPPLQNPKYPRAEDRRRLDAARGLLEAWVEKDAGGVAVFAATHAQDPDITKALGEFTGALFIKSHDQAAAFIRSLPDENSQRAALTEISDYIGGQPFILREGGDDEEPEDPEIPAEDVPAWFTSLPSKLWIDSAGKIFQAWSRKDSASAEAWLRSLPSDVQSTAIVQFVATASGDQVQRVFELLALVGDVNARRDALQEFVRNLGDDPTETRQKINALSLTNQQKQTLLRLVRNKQ